MPKVSWIHKGLSGTVVEHSKIYIVIIYLVAKMQCKVKDFVVIKKSVRTT